MHLPGTKAERCCLLCDLVPLKTSMSGQRQGNSRQGDVAAKLTKATGLLAGACLMRALCGGPASVLT